MTSNTSLPVLTILSLTVRLKEQLQLKRILRQADPFLALMSYRTTPLQATGASPVKLLLGRQIKTTVPTIDKVLLPKWPDFLKVRKADAKAKETYRRTYNRCYGARPLPPLNQGESVVVKLNGEKELKTAGTVKQLHTTPRSYLIQTDCGTLRRNRQHLRPTCPPVQQPEETDSTQASEQQAPPLCIPSGSPVRETVPVEPRGHL